MGAQRHAVILLAAIFLALNGPLAVASAAEPIKNSACLECHGDKTLTKTNAAGKEVPLFVDFGAQHFFGLAPKESGAQRLAGAFVFFDFAVAETDNTVSVRGDIGFIGD